MAENERGGGKEKDEINRALQGLSEKNSANRGSPTRATKRIEGNKLLDEKNGGLRESDRKKKSRGPRVRLSADLEGNRGIREQRRRRKENSKESLRTRKKDQ